MPYALKCGKLYWAPESKIYKAGWSYMDGRLPSADIYITDNKQAARRLCRELRRKLTAFNQISVVDMTNHPKLEAMTIAKLKRNY